MDGPVSMASVGGLRGWRRPAAEGRSAARHRACALLLVSAMTVTPRVAGASAGREPNLVLNGGFDKGQKSPDGWMRTDGLTVFWENTGPWGKCIHMDTDVYRSEWDQHRKTPDQPVRKTITSGLKYDTVGGSVGAFLYSYPIPVDPESSYMIEYDTRGIGGEVFIFLKGYFRCTAEDAARRGTLIFFKPQPDAPSFSLTEMGGVGEEKRQTQEGDYVMTFRKRMVTKFTGDPKQWYHCRGVVEFGKRKQYKVETVLLELYAYWPPGDYYFDNVSMRKITNAAAAAFEADLKAGRIEQVAPAEVP